MYTDNVGRKRWWLVYSLGFAALALAHAWPFLKSGTYFIWGADGYSQMYPVFCYFVSYVRQMLAGLAHGRLSLPLYDFTLGLGGDILSTLNWHGFGNPFYLLGLLAPENKLPLAFSLIVEVQYFLAGLFFMGYCRKMGLRGFGPVLGAWLYAFTGYFAMTVTHPIMAHAAPALVLMLWGAEKILRRESPLLLAVSVFGTALCGFYFLFICSVALALYILLRVWADRPAHYLKTAAWQALRALAAYLSGLGLACAVFLPSVLGYLGSNRTGEGRTGLPALFVGGRGALEWFAHLTSPSYDWFIGALALLCTAFALGAALTKRPEARGVAGGVIAALVFALSPLAQAALVGFGSSNYTRFWFALSFFFSYLAAVYWPRLFDLSKIQRAAGGALVALYALAAALTGWQRDSRVGLAFFAVLYGVVLLGQKSFRKARLRPAGGWADPGPGGPRPEPERAGRPAAVPHGAICPADARRDRGDPAGGRVPHGRERCGPAPVVDLLQHAVCGRVHGGERVLQHSEWRLCQCGAERLGAGRRPAGGFFLPRAGRQHGAEHPGRGALHLCAPGRGGLCAL